MVVGVTGGRWHLEGRGSLDGWMVAWLFGQAKEDR